VRPTVPNQCDDDLLLSYIYGLRKEASNLLPRHSGLSGLLNLYAIVLHDDLRLPCVMI
jgi:hypothetical protein